MPKKPMDEDRIRRKELLEQKKALRKKIKQQQDQYDDDVDDNDNDAVAAAEAEAERQRLFNTTLSIDTTTTNDKVTTTNNNTNATTTSHEHDETSSSSFATVTVRVISLFDLPMDAMHLICSMLCITDVGRFCLLLPFHHQQQHQQSSLSSLSKQSQQQHQQSFPQQHWVYTLRTSYLLSRLCTSTSTGSSSTNIQLCTTEQEARLLLNDVWDIEHMTNTMTKQSSSVVFSKKINTNNIIPNQYLLQVQQQFYYYLRFIEEMVTGYSNIILLSTTRMNTPTNQKKRYIRLPKFVQGRFVSISPEHSIVRVGGNHTHPNGVCAGIASWGVGKRGQLGHNQRQDIRYPTRIRYGIGYRSELRIVQVSAGGGLVRVAHTLLLTSTGRVLSFGTGQYGALGHGYNAAKQLPDVLRPAYIEALSQIPCICVAAGELHSAVITSDGDVYTWGDGFCGQLGHGDKRPITLPKQVTTGGLDEECVSNITCGSRHTIATTEDGECYSWGLGHFGVLGRSFTPFEYDADTALHALSTTTTAVALAAGGHDDNNDDIDLNMRRLAIDNVPHENHVVAALHQLPRVRDNAAELAAHLDLIANLTLDDASDQCIPKLIDSLHGIQLVGASAGHRHSLFLDMNGYLYSCGSGSSGCLGHGNTESSMYPSRINAVDDDENDIRFRQMSAGVDISMAVSITGRVYSWGKTEGGRIGLGMAKSQVTKPRRVYLNDTTAKHAEGSENPNIENDSVKYKAVDVECGYVHSIIVALNGTTYICGGVGVDGEDDGQQQQQQQQQSEDADFDDSNGDRIEQGTPPQMSTDGRPKQIPNLILWQSLPEPKDEIVKKERWQKLGKYEVKGRSKMS